MISLRTACRARSKASSLKGLPIRLPKRFNSTETSTPITSTQQPTRSFPTWVGASLFAVSAGLVYYAFGGFYGKRTNAALGPLSDSKFTPLKIISSVPASENAKLILLDVPPHLMPDDAALAPIFSFYVKDSDIQVQRPYTPLNGIDDDGHIAFWVKRYFDGEVSRWLHGKKAGDELELRGPVRTFDFKDGDYDEIIMISGGTGVTPFVQLLNHTFAKRTPTSAPLKTHYTLLHSSHNPAALPIADVLMNPLVYSVANRHDLTVRLFVDTPTPSDPLVVTGVTASTGRIGKDDVVHVLRDRGVIARPQTWLEWIRKIKPQCSTKEKKIMFLVCGPEPMITAFSGSRLLRRRPDNLPVGGLLGELGFTSRQVRAL